MSSPVRFMGFSYTSWNVLRECQTFFFSFFFFLLFSFGLAVQPVWLEGRASSFQEKPLGLRLLLHSCLFLSSSISCSLSSQRWRWQTQRCVSEEGEVEGEWGMQFTTQLKPSGVNYEEQSKQFQEIPGLRQFVPSWTALSWSCVVSGCPLFWLFLFFFPLSLSSLFGKWTGQ